MASKNKAHKGQRTGVSHYTQYSPGVGVMTILETSWRLVTASSMLPGLKPTTGDILRL